LSPRYATCAFEGATRGRVRFYYPAAREPLYEHFRDFCARPMRPAEPLAVHLVEGAIVFNRWQHRCVYDAKGARVDPSRLVRFADDPKPEFWPSEPQLDSLRVDEEIREPVVFRSMFFKHWGHFLLESIARLWADAVHPELRALSTLYAMAYGETVIDGRYAQFLDLAGVRALTPLESGRRVRLAKCYIPTQTFSLGSFAHPAHLDAPRRVARRLIGETARDDQPIYFSRRDPGLRGHAQRRMRNEAELETELARLGVRIVHMQNFSLAEQIALMNSHRVFIGAWGSAFHNLLFCLNPSEVSTYVLISRWLPRDFVLVDTIVGNEAHYLAVQSHTEKYDETREVDVDVEATLAYLKAQGVI
jgi:capsular polysaccharide biosynthesis protein